MPIGPTIDIEQALEDAEQIARDRRIEGAEPHPIAEDPARSRFEIERPPWQPDGDVLGYVVRVGTAWLYLPPDAEVVIDTTFQGRVAQPIGSLGARHEIVAVGEDTPAVRVHPNPDAFPDGDLQHFAPIRRSDEARRGDEPAYLTTGDFAAKVGEPPPDRGAAIRDSPDQPPRPVEIEPRPPGSTDQPPDRGAALPDDGQPADGGGQPGDQPAGDAGDAAGGGAAGGTAGGELGESPPVDDAEIEQFIRSNYGYLAWVLDHDELGPIFREAVAEGWEPQRLQAAVRSSAWFRDTEPSRREWERISNEEPGRAEQMVSTVVDAIRLEASRLGVTLNDERVRQMAEDAIAAGWVDAEGMRTGMLRVGALLQRAIVSEAEFDPEPASARLLRMPDDTAASGFRYFLEVNRDGQIRLHPVTGENQLDNAVRLHGDPVDVTPDEIAAMDVGESVVSLYGGPGGIDKVAAGLAPDPVVGGTVPGDMAATVETLGQQARDWFVPISDSTLHAWAERILAGEATEEGFQSYLTQMARSRWPDLQSQIDQGITPAEFFSPHQEMIAGLLEMSPAEVDLFGDPRWGRVLEHRPAEEEQPRAMTLAETREWVRSQPEFNTTRRANQDAAEFLEQLGQMFGRVAS